ncbi:MAG TPA: hypothetical protein VH369_12410 [Bryobacteraceae bacterium]
MQPRIGIASGHGFCPGGAFPRTSWVGVPPSGIHTWGFYCGDREHSVGALFTSPFRAPGVLQLFLAGYPSNTRISLQIERLSDGSRFLIRPSHEPHEHWELNEFSLPRSWRGSLVRLVADDESTGPGGWAAFSEPVNITEADFESTVILLLSTIVHFILLILPGFALCAWCVYKGARDVVTAGLLLLAGEGLSGYLAFWFYFIHPRLGYVCDLLLPLAAILYLLSVARKLNSSAKSVIKLLLPSIALTASVALLVLSTGFLYGGLQEALHTATVRFSHPLPADNTLPYLFAKGLRNGYVLRPLFIDWLTSDRPPLQSGMVLSQAPFGHPGQIGYTVISVIAQCLWIPGLWLLLGALRAGRKSTVLVLVTCLFSGFVFINSFFVWPKLLAAAFTLGFFAVLFGEESGLGPFERTLRLVAGGALLALGLLSHGGTAFAIIGAAFAFVALRRRLPLTSLALIVGVSASIYLPWFLYQKFVDPPGDRLLKMHLAGFSPVDKRSFPEILVSAYRELTVHEVIAHKLSNGKLVLGIGFERDYWKTLGLMTDSLLRGNKGAALQLAPAGRNAMFFSFVPSLGFLPVAVLALIAGAKRRFHTNDWKISGTLFLIVGFSLVDWCVLMFGPGTTTLTQGAYAVDLLASAACVSGLWALSGRLAVTVSALQIALNVLLYVGLMRGFIPGGQLPEGYLHPAMLVLCLLSLMAVTYLFVLVGKDTGVWQPNSYPCPSDEHRSQYSAAHRAEDGHPGVAPI